MITISRSAVVTRKTCEMKRYLNYHACLTPDQRTPGIVPLTEGSPKSLVPRIRGQILHAAAEKIFKGESWEDFVTEQCVKIDESMRVEQSVLIRRALKGWQRIRGEVLTDYSVMSSEAEWTWQMTQEVSQSLRLDRVLRRTDDGTLAILDFKTMRAPDKNWIERMLNSEQTHLYIQALRERSNEWVSGIMYEGIIVGSLDADGRQKSPFVMAYSKKNGQASPTYIAGAPRISTLEWSDTEWMDWATSTGVLSELYCTTGPLLPTFAQLLGTKHATSAAELRWHDRVAQVQSFPIDSEEHVGAVASLIEKNPDACLKYGWEYACPYHRLCWDGAQPDADTYRAREDHHG